jgi:hypothetical protein
VRCQTSPQASEIGDLPGRVIGDAGRPRLHRIVGHLPDKTGRPLQGSPLPSFNLVNFRYLLVSPRGFEPGTY